MIDKKNIQDCYKYYKTLDDKPVTIATYRAIVNGFVKYMVRKLLEGYDVRLSASETLGTLAIRGIKIKPELDDEGNVKNAAPDWRATNKLWEKYPELKEKKQLVYHLNEHTNNVRYSIKWFRGNAKLPNKWFYSFTATKGGNGTKRQLSKLIKEGKEYLVIENQNYVKTERVKTKEVH